MARDRWSLSLSRCIALLAAVMAQNCALAQTATSTATATITPAISGMVLRGLHFGSVVAGTTPGTVTIDPRLTGAARLSYSGVAMADAGDISDALFYITGHPNAYYRITLPTSTTVTNPGGATMLVDGFRSCPIGVMVGGTRVYSLRGRVHRHTTGGGRPDFYDEVYIGATLHVAPAQPAGPYFGTFSVSFAFE